jgi:hypothetical protein
MRQIKKVAENGEMSRNRHVLRAIRFASRSESIDRAGSVHNDYVDCMARVVTRCLRTGQPIPTGLDISMVVFKSLPNISIPVHCQVCGNEHYWTPSSAWVEDEKPK